MNQCSDDAGVVSRLQTEVTRLKRQVELDRAKIFSLSGLLVKRLDLGVLEMGSIGCDFLLFSLFRAIRRAQLSFFLV